LAALPLGHAGRVALGMGKRLGGKPAEAVTAELQSRSAAQLFKVFGELKGGAMKFGQALSVIEAAMPEEAIAPYRQALTKLQETAPPMPEATVAQVMASEFGDQWRDRFQDFPMQPAAAASIGQVHRATASDGRTVAVKIQYPGADKALISDLNQMVRMGRLFGSWVPGLDIKPLLEELRARIAEELDYIHESNNQRQFAAAFEGDPEYEIPHVLAASPVVIISEWVEGRPLADVIANGTQAERDHAGLLYQRFLLSSPQRAGLLHADPHPGNFRITEAGKLAVLDYGAAASLPDGLPPAIGRMLRIALEGDAAGVLAGLRAEGFVKPGMDIDPQELLDYLLPFVEPLGAEEFHFSREWLRDLFSRIRDPRTEEFSIGLKLNLPPSYALIHRVWLGATGVTCQIGASVRMREEVERWLPGFADDPFPQS